MIYFLIFISYNTRDLLIYAVGIGCDELKYVYEGDPNFSVFPTFPITLAFKGTSSDVVSFPSPPMLKMPIIPFEGIRTVLDGEREIIKVGNLSIEGSELTLKSRIIGVHCRGSGAFVETESLLVEKGKTVYRMVSGGFYVGAKNFTDSGNTNSQKIIQPETAPTVTVKIPISQQQAKIYRLSGDYNPLHVDDDFATLSGFKTPILHGLCSLGVSVRAVLKEFGDNDPNRFHSVKVRFSKTVNPGDTLIIDMYKVSETKIIFITKSKNTGQAVINNSYVTLHPKSTL